MARGHEITAWEPANAWSVENLRAGHGEDAIGGYRSVYPEIPVVVYGPSEFNVNEALEGFDLAIVHEWNEPALVAAVGLARRSNPRLRALFHDTHHRSVTDPDSMSRYDLSNYDGVLAFGESVREEYLKRGWAKQVWTFHEAADTRVFRPILGLEKTGDLVWIGNWGDDERSAELREFLIQPVHDLRLRATIHGVRYPEQAIRELNDAGIAYKGWLPNYRAPEMFAQYRFTVHVPRRPYAEALAGVPTIRVFEALACGIPLISAPWWDSEGLFGPGSYLTARDGNEMREQMRAVLNDTALAQELASKGLEAIEQRHTCAHRVTELMDIYAAIRPSCVEAAA